MNANILNNVVMNVNTYKTTYKRKNSMCSDKFKIPTKKIILKHFLQYLTTSNNK